MFSFKKHAFNKLAAHSHWERVHEDLLPDVERARGHVYAGKLDVAIATLTDVLLEKPDPDLYRLLALCYRTAEEPAEAEIMEELADHHS